VGDRFADTSARTSDYGNLTFQASVHIVISQLSVVFCLLLLATDNRQMSQD
jgi:hypothetical protein